MSIWDYYDRVYLTEPDESEYDQDDYYEYVDCDDLEDDDYD